MKQLQFFALALLFAVIFVGSGSDSGSANEIELNAELDTSKEWSREDINKLPRRIINENTSLATFELQYSQKTFVIYDSKKNGDYHVRESNRFLIMSQHETILSVLKNFGHLIRKLVVKYSYAHSNGVENVEEINEAINLYCADTQFQFEVDSQRTNFFSKMTKPFKNVEEVIIRGRFFNIGNGKLNFNQLFPAIRSLTLKDVFAVYRDKLTDLNLPHLEHLIVDIERDVYCFKEYDYINFLSHNPQIKYLTLFYASRPFLKKVRQLLPNLQYLELIDYDDSSDFEYSDNTPLVNRVFKSVLNAAKQLLPKASKNNDDTNMKENGGIPFESITNFTIHDLSNDIPGNFTFTYLDEFHAVVKPGDSEKLIEFVEKHSNLRKFVVDKGHFDKIDFQKLNEAHLDLEDIVLNLKNVDNASIIDFVRKNEGLRKIKITRNKSLEEVFEINELGDEWIVNATNTEISLEKRD